MLKSSKKMALKDFNANEEDNNSNINAEVKPRDFFWDKIILFAVSSILGLTAIDLVSEYIRGGDVACFSPHGVELTEAQGAYLNSFCAGSLPPGAYISISMAVHAVIITIPHILWLKQYGGNFELFFHLSSLLKRIREEGEYTKENFAIVQQLEGTFTTYGCNTIFKLYKVKLFFQLLWSMAGIMFIVVFFDQAFQPNFSCPGDNSNVTNLPFWPLDTGIVCVFHPLELLHTLWLAEISLLGIVCFGLFWALVWCFASHPSELGAKTIALFSFRSGLAPMLYVPALSALPWPFQYVSLSGFRIQTDLDFLLLKVFRADYGLGHVFRDVQIQKEIKGLAEDDRRRVAIHRKTQISFNADNVNSLAGRNGEARKYRMLDEQDFKWRFSKATREVGVYDEFETLPTSHNLLLPDAMRGAVLAFAQRATDNENAISISFGDTGYASALARVFIRAASLNFSPDYNFADEVVSVTEYTTCLASLVFPENIFSSPTRNVLQFVEKLRAIWVPLESDPQFNETSFIVVGPIPKRKEFNATNMHLLFNELYGCLEKGTVLLTVHPLEISGRRVMEEFISYEPLEPHFIPLRQEPPVFPSDRTQPAEWPARSSILRAAKEQAIPGPSVPVTSLPYQFPVTVHSGGTEIKVLFSTYYYTNAEEIPRPQMFNP